MWASPAIRTVAAGTIDSSARAHRRRPTIRMISVPCRAGIGLGHRRLSIISLSALGGQPLFNEDDTVCVTLKANSISLFPSLAATSRRLNRRFRSL